MKFTLFALCIALAALITPGKAKIDCFECDGAGCEDPYDGPEEHVVQECNHCEKSIIKGSGHGPTDGTVRSCMSGEPIFMGCRSESHGGIRATVCYCDTDRCNSGATIYLALSALVSTLALNYLI